MISEAWVVGVISVRLFARCPLDAVASAVTSEAAVIGPICMIRLARHHLVKVFSTTILGQSFSTAILGQSFSTTILVPASLVQEVNLPRGCQGKNRKKDEKTHEAKRSSRT